MQLMFRVVFVCSLITDLCCVQTTLATDLGSERLLVLNVESILKELWGSAFNIAEHIDQGKLSRSKLLEELTL